MGWGFSFSFLFFFFKLRVTGNGFDLYTNTVSCRPAVLKVRARTDCQRSWGRGVPRGADAAGATPEGVRVAGGLGRGSGWPGPPTSEAEGSLKLLWNRLCLQLTHSLP